MLFTEKNLHHLVEGLELPKQRIIFIHARIKYLQQCSQLSYTQLTQTLLHALQNSQPTAVLVPAYTIYTFMRTRLFHCVFSHSDTGRFSEEIRQHIPHWRSPDPMYSVLDLNHYLPQLDLDYSETFSQQGLFAHLYENNAIILNIDMPGFWATPIHRVEIQNRIDYRYLQRLQGIVYQDETHWKTVNYTAYLRKVNADYHAYPLYDQRKRLDFLWEKQVLHIQEQQGINLRWVDVQSFEHTMNQALQQDKNFLLASSNAQQSLDTPWLT